MVLGELRLMKVTFVSALFDINRVDGRKWDEYLKWFDITIKLKVPMVLFVSEDLKTFIEDRRENIPTEIECTLVLISLKTSFKSEIISFLTCILK